MKRLSLLLLFFLLCSSLYSQQNRYKAGAVLGLNFSELEGDGLFAYPGWNAGLVGTTRFSERLQLSVEMLFSQNGEYVAPKFYPKVDYGKIKLNHVEIPLHLDLLIKQQKKKAYAEWNLQFGFAYALLLGYKIHNATEEDISEQIIYKDKNALLAQAGTTYFFTKNIGLNLRATLPITETGMSWTVAGRLVYML